MSNVAQIPVAAKGKDKKKSIPSLITMDQYLLANQKKSIVAEINRLLMDSGSAALLGVNPIQRPIDPAYMELRKFYYYRVNWSEFIADIQVRIKAPRCHFTMYYSMICDMEGAFEAETYGYSRELPDHEELPLDKYLIPYLGWDNIEKETETIWLTRLPQVFSEPRWLRAFHLAGKMHLTIIQRKLPKKRVRSMVFFQKKEIDVEDDHKETVPEIIPAGTIVLNMNAIRNDNSGIDIYHECIHWEWHYMFFKLQEMYCTDMTTVKMVKSADDGAEARQVLWGLEWQARQGSCRLMLPERLARPWIMEGYSNVVKKYALEGARFQDIAFSIGKERCIPYSRVRGRMIQLGYWQAKGAVNWVDGKYIAPFDFDRDSCRGGKTFVIDREHAKELYQRDESFREMLSNGDYVFADGHFVLNDDRYVQPTRYGAVLTDEALARLDKCCLLFDLIWSVEDEDFELGCLYSCEEYNRYYFMCVDPECEHTRAENTESIGKILKHLGSCNMPEALTYLMEEALAKQYTPRELEETSWVSARTISNYMKEELREYDIDVLVALCVGLHLNPRISEMLLEIAGKKVSRTKNAGTYDFILTALFMDDMEKVQAELKKEKMELLRVKERKERRTA